MWNATRNTVGAPSRSRRVRLIGFRPLRRVDRCVAVERALPVGNGPHAARARQRRRGTGATHRLHAIGTLVGRPDGPKRVSGCSRPEAAPGHRESGPAGAALDRKTRPLAVAGEGIRASVRFWYPTVTNGTAIAAARVDGPVAGRTDPRLRRARGVDGGSGWP